MDITVLGCGAAFPRAGGACSGFLVRSGDTNVWIDAGNGTFAQLQRYVDCRALDALVLTHGHADHVADVLPLMYALGFDPVLPMVTLPVHSPMDVVASLKWPLGGTSKERFTSVFAFRPISEPFTIGSITFEPFQTKHPADTYGLRMSDNGKTAVYTSDTAWFEELPDRCRDADVLISEATYVDGVDAPPGVHLTAREAGRLAAAANVKRLVLTHIWATIDPSLAVAEAAEEFDGPVEAALEGNRYEI